MLNYLTGGGSEQILFGDDALGHMIAYRQLQDEDCEAGGQLFARFSEACVEVLVATGPHSQDQRTRLSFLPNRTVERREIADFHRRGLHYVGDWHTHPEPVPNPSFVDLANIRTIFSHSQHSYGAILMVIVGQSDFPEGLFVGIADSASVTQLHHVPGN
jgi:integrative and conjugative element protein (TIGR02256 family)